MVSSELFQKIRQIEIYTRHLVDDSFAGAYLSVFKGRGMEFEEVRPYQPGDEVRSIDWNVTARMGTPYVKRYVEERELTVVLLVDASASQRFGSVRRFKRELAAEIAAVLAFSATSNNDRVGLLVFTDRVELFIPPRKGRKHVLRILRELLTFQPQRKGTDISLALQTVNRVLKRRGILFLISDFIAEAEGFHRPLAITNRRHDLIAIELRDPLDELLPPIGLLQLEDAERGALLCVDSTHPDWQGGFRRQVARLRAERARVFTRAQVDHLVVSTDADYVHVLAAFFQQRARRLAR